MQPSFSENTTGSKRCCNRSTCPFYCNPNHNSQSTPYVSAIDGSSTQFLYFGQNFQRNASGEVMEFQDCNSESDVQRSLPTLARSMHQAAASLQRVDSVNYGMILKQIIVLSNKLLEHMEQKGRGGGQVGGPTSSPQRLLPSHLPENYPSPQMGPTQYAAGQQMAATVFPSGSPTYTHPQSFGAPFFGGQPMQGGIRGNEIDTTVTMGPLPVDMRMLHIEPVHLTIPFTLHFQSIPTDERAQGPVPSSVMEPIRTAAVSSSMPPHPTTATSLPFDQHQHTQTGTSLVNQGQFPFSIGMQADAFVSEGKFPPYMVQSPSVPQVFSHKHINGSLSSQEKQFQDNKPWSMGQSDGLECTLEETCDLKRDFREHSGGTSQPPSNADLTVTEMDKAVQTEKPSRRDPQTGDKKKPYDTTDSKIPRSDDNIAGEQSEMEMSQMPEMPEMPRKMVRPDRCICDVCVCQPKSKEPPPVPPKPFTEEKRFEPDYPPKPPRKSYRLALPQHKDLEICNKCRFHPSPLFDSEGRAFCPGKCGCCLCPWKSRAPGDPQRHDKIKVCKCRERLTIFTDNNSGNLECSTSFFDVCPCREKAEATFLEMFNCEMYNADDTLAEQCWGDEVFLSDVVEIKKRVRSTERPSQADSNRNNSHLNPDNESSKFPNELSTDHHSQLNTPHLEVEEEEEKSPHWLGSQEQTEVLVKSEIEVEEEEDEELRNRIQQLEEEQQLYVKPPPLLEPTDVSASAKLPHNMNYPSQFGREQAMRQDPCAPDPCEPLFTCLASMRAQMPQINIPMCCRCMCRRRKSRSKMRKTCSKAPFECKSVCRGGKRLTVCTGDEEFYSAQSDSEAESVAHQLTAKKARSNIRKPDAPGHEVARRLADMKPDAAMLEVLEQMMEVLVRMDAKNRGGEFPSAFQTARSTPVQTLYESCPDDAAMRPDPRAFVSEANARTTYAFDGQNRQRRNFTCLPPSNMGDDEEEPIPDPCTETSQQPISSTSTLPYLVITFDPVTGQPCCIMRSGAVDSVCPYETEPTAHPCEQRQYAERQHERDLLEEMEREKGTADGAQQSPGVKLIEEEIQGEGMPPEFQMQIPQSSLIERASLRQVSNAMGPVDGINIIIGEEANMVEERGGFVIKDELQVINETNIKLTITEDYQQDTMNREIVPQGTMICNPECIVTCAETQTEDCLGPFMTTLPQDVIIPSTDMLEELRAFRDDLCEDDDDEGEDYSCSRMLDMRSRKSQSGGDLGVECDCCHCRAARELQSKVPMAVKPGHVVCGNVDDCKQQLKCIVDSIIADLEAMEMVRRNNCANMGLDIPRLPPKHARQSYPVTITEVSELGRSSLYVKWTIHDCFGIGGYEIYVDGYLTNRYFNAKHEAAVVCDVDVMEPHKVALFAKPKPHPGKALLGAGDVCINEDEITIVPASWTPSIYLYEPSTAMDYCKHFE